VKYLFQSLAPAVRRKLSIFRMSFRSNIVSGRAFVLLLSGLGLAWIQVSFAGETTSLKVAAVQMRSTRSLVENLSRITNSIHKCAKEGARVVVFPECALPGYFGDAATKLSAEEIAAAEEQVAGACCAAGIYAVVGSAWRDGDKVFNSALIVTPAGKVIERYHKIQLAEPWPKPGDHLSVFRIDGVPCSVIICHDERYPELVRLPVLAGAKLVFYISSESGLREEKKLEPYRAQIQARAVENTVYVVQANAPANKDASGSHGQSRIIAPDGNIIEEASFFNEDVLIQTLDLRKASRSNALNSIKRGPLGDWWQEGVKRVRIIE
jgi:predicted amidohydrolase